MQELTPHLSAESVAEDQFTAVKLNRVTGQTLTADGGFLKVFTDKSASPVIRQKLPSSLYDYCWSPGHFLLVLRDLPLTLKSGETGLTVSQYSVLNQVDEVRAPLSASFSGPRKIVTGLGNRLITGDLETHVFEYHCLDDGTLSSRSILSAFDCDEELAVVGSYNCETYLYDLRAEALTARLTGQQGGIIQLSLRQNTLLSAGRKDDFVLHWDLRQLSHPVNSASFYREHKTHQRVLFSHDSHWLGLGNSNGSVYIYDLLTSNLAYYFAADFDAINSVQLEGTRLITSSGQRHLTERPSSLIRDWSLLELEH